MMPKIDAPAVVIPVYGQYKYARKCIRSLLVTAPESLAVVVEDGHESWSPEAREQLLRGLDMKRITVLEHGKNRGVTRAWNTGIVEAMKQGYAYIGTGNSDLLFPAGWWEAAKRGLAQAPFIGPISNAPGDSPVQHLDKWLPGVEIQDTQERLDDISAAVIAKHKYALESPTDGWYLNGFFHIGTREAWEQMRSSTENYYSNSEDLRMVGSETDLFRRAKKAGLKPKVALSCFVFHYRSATRGPKFFRGLSFFRPTDAE